MSNMKRPVDPDFAQLQAWQNSLWFKSLYWAVFILGALAVTGVVAFKFFY